MNTILRMSAASAAVFLLAGSMRADMPGGHTRPPATIWPHNAVAIRLEAVDEATEATLYLPRRLLKKAKPTAGDGKQTHATILPVTLVGGVGLAFALTASCLGFLRLRGRPGTKTLAAILALSGLLIAGRCTLQANAPDAVQVHFSGGVVKVAVTEYGDAVHLVVPKSRLDEWAARLRPPEKKTP